MRGKCRGMRVELVVLVGLQGAGKSTYYRRHYAATHRLVSKDLWPNARRREARQRRVVAELLAAGADVVVDNTNPGVADRAPLVGLAREHGARCVAAFLDVPLQVCLDRNAGRVGRARVSVVGVLDTCRRLVPPSLDEGFDEVRTVPGAGLSPVPEGEG